VPYRSQFIALMLLSSFGTGLLLALLLVVACHHWRRWVYIAVVTFVTIVTGAIVVLVWREIAPNLLWWGARQSVEQAGAHLAGCLVGVYFGRALARLVVVWLLPPRLAQHVGFLWRADGKEPPRIEASPASAGAAGD
jgi:hypothetical protein